VDKGDAIKGEVFEVVYKCNLKERYTREIQILK